MHAIVDDQGIEWAACEVVAPIISGELQYSRWDECWYYARAQYKAFDQYGMTNILFLDADDVDNRAAAIDELARDHGIVVPW